MTVNELYLLSGSPIEVKSGYNGKLLCKRFLPEKHQSIGERKVLTIWTEVRTGTIGGYTQTIRTVLCAYVHGDKERQEEEEKKK